MNAPQQLERMPRVAALISIPGFAHLAVLALALLVASPAKATLIPLDSRQGPSTIIRDTATGLDWLSLRVTQGFSINSILTATAPGGSLAEFRLANYDEVNPLIISLGFDIPPYYLDCTHCHAQVQEFGELFGARRGLLGP